MTEKLSAKEAARLIVQWWQIGLTPEAIMLALLMRGRALRKHEILQVIRVYVDSQTENGTYKTDRSGK